LWKPTGNQQENHGKTLPKLHQKILTEVKNGRLAFNREIQLDTLEAPSKIALVFGNCKFPNETLWILDDFGVEVEIPKEDPKKEIWNEGSYIILFEIQMITV